jgi:hypothetical protein
LLLARFDEARFFGRERRREINFDGRASRSFNFRRDIFHGRSFDVRRG